MAKLTTAQLNAVITTIRNTVSENNEKKRIEFEKTLNKDKEYLKSKVREQLGENAVSQVLNGMINVVADTGDLTVLAAEAHLI